MMMNYLYVSKKKKPQSSRAARIGSFVLIAVVIALIVWGKALFSLLTGFWSAESYITQSASVSSGWFADKAELIAKVNELQHINDDLKVQLIEQATKTQAYDELVGIMGTSTKGEGTLAKIVRRPPYTVFDTYVIDKGAMDGIAQNDIVYAHDVPVGTIASVTAHNAIVSLYSSPGNKILVTFGTTSAQYEAYGIGNASLRADIPRDASVENGMTVTADDRSMTIYGSISGIDKESDNTNTSVFISLPFDIGYTSWVTVKKP
ncbi:MAG: rod shape-determining protein MreC [Candidatus Parcubacteria bacterium]|jgi:cell shape-determining protein MreC